MLAQLLTRPEPMAVADTQVRIFDSPEEVAHAAALLFIDSSKQAILANQRFSVALAGGSTPRGVYELLASDAYRNQLDWSNTHLFFGDERCVPPTDAASNYRMAYETMIGRLPIPAEQVHPIKGEGDPEANARAYEDELKRYFPNFGWPRFDLIFLGLGDDGHTASLFPYTAALEEKESWVVANRVDKLEDVRITLTAPAINHAMKIAFLVTGKEKAVALAAVLRGTIGTEMYPAQLVRPVDGSLVWLVDKSAALYL